MKGWDAILLAARPARPAAGLRLVALLFGTVFGAGGVAAAWSMLIAPWLRVTESRDWQAVPAMVTASGLERGSGSKGATVYAIAIRYDYTWQGRTHHGSRYDFTHGKTNVGVGDMRRVVADHPVGAAVTAWVDPANPDQSVLHRGIAKQGLIGILFPLPFLAVGICGLSYALLAGSWFRRSRQAVDRCRSEAQIENLPLLEAVLAEEPARRKSNFSEPFHRPFHYLPGRRWLDAGALLFVCVFWNGIVGVFLSVMVLEIRSGDPPWFLIVFLIPFVLIGLLFLMLLARQLRHARPPALMVASHLTPATVRLEWLDRSHVPALHLGFRVRPATTNLLQLAKHPRRLHALRDDAHAAPSAPKGSLELAMPPEPEPRRWRSQMSGGVSLDVFWTRNDRDWHCQTVSLIDPVSTRS